jgi:hypothetical protein
MKKGKNNLGRNPIGVKYRLSQTLFKTRNSGSVTLAFARANLNPIVGEGPG